MAIVPQQNRTRTIRGSMADLMEQAPHSARDLSKILGIRENEILEHLSHIERSVAVKGKKLKIVPAKCLSCGYTFKKRKRFSRPGRCPSCRNTHIEAPLYRID